MNAKNRSMLRLFLLVIALLLALVFGCRAKANPTPADEPRHLFEIVGRPAQVYLPGTGDRIELPVGSVFGGDEFTYHLGAQVTRIVVTVPIFGDGFGD